MPPPIALSKLKVLSFLRCPRKLWLEQYSPELEDEDAIERDVAEAERIRHRIAEMHGRMGGTRITGERGLRAAVNETSEIVAAGTQQTIFDATFDHDGLTVQIHRLEIAADGPRFLTLAPGTTVEQRHLDECAIQAWTLAHAGLDARAISIGLLDADNGPGCEIDVTESVRARLTDIEGIVEQTRTTLAALDEPADPMGAHCRAPHACPFLNYCNDPP